MNFFSLASLLLGNGTHIFFFFLQNITYYTKLKLFTTEYLQCGTYATRYYYYIRYYYNLARGTNVNNVYKIYETF